MPTILALSGAPRHVMKLEPVIAALGEAGTTVGRVHAGPVDDAFYSRFGIPKPEVALELETETHAVETGRLLTLFETVLDRFSPDAILAAGEGNSTLAASLVAAKRDVPVIHVDAGLRSFDRSKSEEINRVLTEQIAEVLFTAERQAGENLLREGVAEERIHLVGGVLVDGLTRYVDRAPALDETLRELGRRDLLEDDGTYGVVTLVDADESLVETLEQVSRRLPLVFPMRGSGLETRESPTLVPLPPLPYLESMGLLRDAKLVLTDSARTAEETTALGVPCLTLRETTERPITVTEGTNTLVGADASRIDKEVDAILETGGKRGRRPELWDGGAAPRIAEILQGDEQLLEAMKSKS